jgi:hypothetical protein
MHSRAFFFCLPYLFQSGWINIPLNWDSLLIAVYISATCIIAFSAVAGRVSFGQT